MDSINSGEKPEKAAKCRLFRNSRFIFCLLNLACFMQLANTQLLPVTMRGLEKDLGFSPKQLSSFIVAEQVAMSLFIPVWGVLSDLYELKVLLILSLFLSGAFLVMVGCVRDFYLMFFLRAFNMAAMGAMFPCSQKYVVVSGMKRVALAFGILHTVGNLGRLACYMSTAPFNSNEYSNVFGWRIASFAIGGLLVLTGIVLFLIPTLKNENYKRKLFDLFDLEETRTLLGVIGAVWRRLLGILSSKTVWLIVLNGVYAASFYMFLFFQYCGFSNAKSAVTAASGWFGSMAGGILGGPVVDLMHKRLPRYGRLCFGIGALTVRLICLLFFFLGINLENVLSQYAMLTTLVFIIGSTFAIVAIVDRPVITDVVLPSEQGFAVSCTVLLSTVAGASCLNPLLGFLLMDVFGYVKSRLDVTEMTNDFRLNNARAILKGFSFTCITCTSINLLIYLTMILTYPREARRIKDKVEDSKEPRTEVAAESPATECSCQTNL